MTIEIGKPVKSELDSIMAIENADFTPDEAASRSSMAERIETLTDSFFVARENGAVVGFIVGPVTSSRYLTDDLFEHSLTNPASGGFQSVTSLAVHPEHEGKGIATMLIDRLLEEAKKSSRQAVTLTCLEHLIPFYEAHGFVNEGISESQHAGETWYNLVYEL